MTEQIEPLIRVSEGEEISASAWNLLRQSAQRDAVSTYGLLTNKGANSRAQVLTVPPRLFELTEDMLHPDDLGAIPPGETTYPDVRYANNAKPVDHDLGTNAYIIDPTNLFTTIYETGIKSGGMSTEDTRYLTGDRVWCNWNRKSERWEFRQTPRIPISAFTEIPFPFGIIFTLDGSTSQVDVTWGFPLNNIGDTGFDIVGGVLTNVSGVVVEGIVSWSVSMQRTTRVDGRDYVEVSLLKAGTTVRGSVGRISTTSIAEVGYGNTCSGAILERIPDGDTLVLRLDRKVPSKTPPWNADTWKTIASGVHLTFQRFL